MPAICFYPTPDQSSPCSPYPTSWRSILILSSHLCMGLLSALFSSRFLTSFLYPLLLSPIHATCPAYLILLYLITRIIFDEEYISLCSSSCRFLHSPVTLSPLGPNILLSTLFSYALRLHSSLNMSDQVSQPYKTAGKIIFLRIYLQI